MSIKKHGGIFGRNPTFNDVDVEGTLTVDGSFVVNGASMAPIFRGTWNADTNTPTLASGVGTQGDFYIVSVGGDTNLDGASTWGVGDWVLFNGSAWQRVEGGVDGDFGNILISGNTISTTNANGTLEINPDGTGGVGIGGDTVGVVAGATVSSKFCAKNELVRPTAGFVHAENTTANSGSWVYACRSRGTLAAPTAVQNNDNLATWFVAGHDGTDLAIASQITFDVDGTPGNNDMPGRIVVSTTPDGTQIPVEAVRINNAQVTTFAKNPVLTDGTASTALALDSNKAVVSVTNTGTGNNVLATDPTIGGATITGGTINNTPIGGTTASTGAFTTASASTSVTTPLIANAGTLDLSATGANIITASTNSVERMRITSDGNVGIGTGSPKSKLDARTSNGAFNVLANSFGIGVGGNISQTLFSVTMPFGAGTFPTCTLLLNVKVAITNDANDRTVRSQSFIVTLARNGVTSSATPVVSNVASIGSAITNQVGSSTLSGSMSVTVTDPSATSSALTVDIQVNQNLSFNSQRLVGFSALILDTHPDVTFS